MRSLTVLILILLPGLGFIGKCQVPKPPDRLLPLANSNGLSNNRIYSIVQDKQGYMWFGTEEGLNRYNGQSITVFRFKPGDQSSLHANSISRMIVDQRGLIWIGSNGGGLSYYNPLSGTFTAYRHEVDNPNSLPSNHVQFLLESRKGEIWIGADNGGGLIRLDPRTKKFTQYFPNRDTVTSHVTIHNGNSVLSLSEDEDGTLWLGTRDGLYHFYPEREQFEAYRDQPESQSEEFENLIVTLYQDAPDTLWLGCWGGGLKIFNKRTKQYQTYRYVPQKELDGNFNQVVSMIRKSESELWVSTLDRGLAIFNKRTEVFDFIRADSLTPSNHDPAQASYLYQDRAGMLWVGTYDGVRYINPHEKCFQSIRLPSSAQVGIQNTVVTCYSQGENLHAGALASEGLYRYHKRKAGWDTYPFTNLPHDVLDIVRAQSGILWVSTSVGIFHLDTIQQKFIPLSFPKNNASAWQNATFFRLLEDKRGTIWIGTVKDGLFRYHSRSHSLTHYQAKPNGSNSLVGNGVWAIAEDQQGYIWVSTSSGLSRLNPATHTFTNFTYDSRKGNGLPSNLLSDIVLDHRGDLWIGTRGEGLCRLSGLKKGKPTFTLYTVDDGLPSNRITHLVRDKAGRMWLNTAKGLSCFDPKHETIRFRTFDQRDGLPEEQLDNMLKVAETGHIYLGAAGSLIYFHPDSLLKSQLVSPLKIYSLKIFDKEAQLDSTIEFKQRVRLLFDENFFTLSFALLHYVNPEKNQYRYTLEGYDRGWNKASNLNFATYKKVPPGQYTFRVKATSNYGGWQEQESTLQIVILPPWWRTWWSYLGYSILVLAALWGARREIVKRERLKADLRIRQVEADKLKELDKVRSRFFANISHEFRTPLTLVLNIVKDKMRLWQEGKLSEVKLKGQELRVMHRNAQRLLELIDQLLDLSKIEAGSLPLHNQSGDLMAFIRYIAASFHSLAESRHIQYQCDLTPNTLRVSFDKDKIEKIITNLLSNAFKFTPEAGTVRLEVTATDQAPGAAVVIKVTDSGIGIAPEEQTRIFERFYQVDTSATRAYEGSGIGLALSKELVTLYGGSIGVDSKPGEGTTFTVQLVLEPALAEPSQEPGAVPPAVTTGVNTRGVETSEGTDPYESSGYEEKHYEEKLLIAEDNPDLRAYLRESLAPTYQVLEATNGAEALQIALAQVPDLLISDVMMPLMDGFTLCDTLKTDERTSHIPVILLTARAGTENKLEGLRIGADAYLVKPFDSRELLIRTKNLIESRKKLRERYSKGFMLQPSAIPLASADEKFLSKLREVIENKLSDEDFTVEELGDAMALSRVQLYRKLYALTNQSPSDLIRSMRLQRAKQLLESRVGNISEIGYQVGFKTPGHFSKSFSKEFGLSPTDFLLSLGTKA